jgi:hypothetical protein
MIAGSASGLVDSGQKHCMRLNHFNNAFTHGSHTGATIEPERRQLARLVMGGIAQAVSLAGDRHFRRAMIVSEQ